MQSTVVQVHAHTRVWALRYVLEGLRRQEALPVTQVWLDGHQLKRNLKPYVVVCADLEQEFPEAKWIKYGSHRGTIKLNDRRAPVQCEPVREYHRLGGRLLSGSGCNRNPCQQPRPDTRRPAVLFRLRASPRWSHRRRRDDCLPVVGLGNDGAKLQPILQEFTRLWNLLEQECMAWVVAHLTESGGTRAASSARSESCTHRLST